MKSRLRLLAAASIIAMVGIGSTAHAAGTTAGSSIVNNVSVNYQVGGVSQTAINASNTLVVDRKITLTVAEVGTITTSVSPGQTAAVTTFTVTNTTNATLDLGLTLAQQAGGLGPHGGTDNFDVTAPSLFVDTNANGVYDAGTDQAVTYLDEIAADTSRTVFAVANIPVGQANNSVAAVTLTAQALEGGTAGAQGAVIAQTGTANTAGMDTVFADGAGATDAARDGQFSAKDDYTVSAALLTVTKLSKVISDPFNGTTNPKLIPGAVVEYCIVVSNAAGGAAANNIGISDPLPAQTAYDVGYGIFLNGTVTGGVCNTDGTAGGSFAAGTVSGTLASVPTATTRTLYFRTTIN